MFEAMSNMVFFLLRMPGMATIYSPQQHEDAEIDAFLACHFNESMYLRAQLLRTRERAHFALARQDGMIVAVAAQVASGMVLLQAPEYAAEVTRFVLGATGQRLAGFFGSIAQVTAARTGLGLDGVRFAKDTHEDLFALALAELRAPAMLREGRASCRVADERDLELLVRWRADFRVAVMKDANDAALPITSRRDIADLLPEGSLFILEAGEPVACCSFNARLPQAVNIGNVWTPEPMRGKGYARAVVAGALAIAEKSGVRTAVLATGRHNVAARSAYVSIGFERVGDYATAIIEASCDA